MSNESSTKSSRCIKLKTSILILLWKKGSIEVSKTAVAAVSGAAEAEGSSNSAAIPPGLAVELDQLIPEAENGTTNQVTVLMGETVLLPCKAYSLGQRTVSLFHYISLGFISGTIMCHFGLFSLKKTCNVGWHLKCRPLLDVRRDYVYVFKNF